MKQVIDINKIPIKLWLDDIEDGAKDQATNLANLPFAFKHIAIMPDSHQGYGMPIGAILATKGVVIPNAVGVDIGCGMCAVRTSLTDISTEQLKKIMGGSKGYKGGIRTKIPLGSNKHSKKQDNNLMPYDPAMLPKCPIVDKEYENALKQLGTLGGGNHFIEIQKGNDGYIYVMIHSGSRNLGYTVAKHYNDIAIELNKKYHSIVDKKQELAFLPIDSMEANNYIDEMNYCVEFALANRSLMLDRIKDCFYEVMHDVTFDKMINLSHNFAAMENHFGQNVLVHRKGATRAYKGKLGIIPGSQGTSSYIVKGKGNIESFKSCSHGAGRVMSRTQAKKYLNLAVEKKRLDDMGIIHSVRNISDLDEAPGSYKDIDVVMENQKDLVNIEVKLTPLAVIKG